MLPLLLHLYCTWCAKHIVAFMTNDKVIKLHIKHDQTSMTKWQYNVTIKAIVLKEIYKLKVKTLLI